MLLSLSAAAQQSGDFLYTTNGNAITVTGYTGPGGAVVIPATIGGLPLTQLTTVVFEATTNLVKGPWVPLENATLTNEVLSFHDAQWTRFPARFYRIRSP